MPLLFGLHCADVEVLVTGELPPSSSLLVIIPEVDLGEAAVLLAGDMILLLLAGEAVLKIPIFGDTALAL